MSDAPRHPRHGNWIAVFGLPIVIGVLSLAGLLSALLFNELGRIFSWFAVGLPLAITAWVYVRRNR
ncbi:MAG: hypothetical protein JWP84_299 [Tardiphaga sp.]|nr:hypothetical protein [Tardiphaga sp.]